MDIKFEVDGYKFNVRSSCIIKNKTHSKVLLTNMRAITDHEAFLLPGGRLELLENSDEAIKREIEEELKLKLDFKLISIEENISKAFMITVLSAGILCVATFLMCVFEPEYRVTK